MVNGDTQAMRPGRRQLWRLLMLVLAAMLPLVVLLAALVWQGHSRVRAHAESQARSRAQRLADDGAAVVQRAQRALEFLATRPELQQLDPSACQRFVDSLAGADPLLANVGVADTGGRLVCASAMPADRRQLAFDERPWFRRAMAEEGVVIGEPTRGLLVDRPVLHMARAIVDVGGRRLGVAMLSLDLVAFSGRLGGSELPPGSSITLSDARGLVVARYPDAAKWVGGDASALTRAFKAGHADGPGEVRGADGVTRIYTMAPLAGVDWTAVVGLAPAGVEAPAWATLREALLGLALALAASAGLAVLLARRISQPLEALARTAQHVAAGDASARAPLAASGELRTVAQQFNEMLERQQQTEQGLRRANSLYEVLTRTNHAVVGGGDFEAIANEVCRACVESGNAVLVAVFVADDAHTGRIIAGAGPLTEVFGASALGWPYSDPALAHLPTPMALRTGEPVICNDYLAVQGPPELRERAIVMGVRAVAVFPLRREGEIWGALLFQTDQVGWFDAAREQLLRALADGLSLVLDNQAREQQRRQARQALEQRDHQLAGIIETAMDAVITIGADQRIRVFNAAASRIFRIPADEALGQPVDRFIPRAARAGHAGHVQAFARDGAAAAHRMGRLRQLSGLRADGSEFPIEASIARHGEGDAVLMTAIIRDVSDAKAAEQARQAQLAAEAASQAKSAFLANMSHEIRTPMNAVLGFTDLALRTELTPQQAGYLSKARVAGETLLGLIDDILDLSKIEAGKLELEQAEFELDALVQAVQVIVGQRAEAKGLAFSMALQGEAPRLVVGDLQRLRQVLINLAGNAVKFTASGEVRVTLECLPADEASLKLRCRIVDTGIGMSPEQLQRLFQPFSQGDASMTRRFGGTGLGLVISRQLVELMGGSIDVSSLPGQGSEFSFTIRLGRGSRAAGPTPVPPVAADQALRRLAGRRVLLVEDNEVNQVLAGELLSSVAGVELDIVGSGLQAIEAIARQRYELVLMDVQMPGMDGYETVRRLRADPANRLLPVIAMTAHASDSDRRDCLAAGMNDFVTKPVHPDLLFRVMARWLGDGSAPPTVAPDRPVSFDAGLQHCFGRTELYERVIASFVQAHVDLHPQLARAWEAGDVEGAMTLLHGLLSSAMSVGALPLAAQARALVAALRDPGERDMEQRFDRLRQQHAATLEALSAWRGGDPRE